MVVHRMGCKGRFAEDIIKWFPPHKVYIEPFFGAGGIYFKKPQVPYNIVNDLDNDIYNLYMIIKDDDNVIKLQNAINNLIISETLFHHWRFNEESDPIMKAVRFLFLSNFSLYNNGRTFKCRIDMGIYKSKIIVDMNYTRKLLKNVVFTSKDFREFFNDIDFFNFKDRKEDVFIYADPPYIGTTYSYNTPNKWSVDDTKDLFHLLTDMEYLFAISEFNNEEIMGIAINYNLYITEICERRNLNSDERRNEILITNYDTKDLQYSLL